MKYYFHRVKNFLDDPAAIDEILSMINTFFILSKALKCCIADRVRVYTQFVAITTINIGLKGNIIIIIVATDHK